MSNRFSHSNDLATIKLIKFKNILMLECASVINTWKSLARWYR